MSKSISLSRGIYPEWAVVRAVKDYGTLAAIEVRAEDERIVCRFSQCRYDEQLTVWEFLNYLIDLLNSTTCA